MNTGSYSSAPHPLPLPAARFARVGRGDARPDASSTRHGSFIALNRRNSLFSPPPMRSMAGRGGGGGAAAHGSGDRLHHALDIPQHIVVPEAQHAIAARLEIGGSLGIAH